MKKNSLTTLTLLAILLLITIASTFATRHVVEKTKQVEVRNNGTHNGGGPKTKKPGSGGSGSFGGFFGPGGGFNIPGLGGGGVYGGGFGKGGVVSASVVCKEKGPCLGKKLRCPAKCYQSFSSAGKGYGFGGGSGGCTMDCKKKCVAYC
ncbi:unnamed protein product [Withania somnifera]